MPLSDIVDVQITTESSKVTQKGFGVILIPTYHTVFTERARRYSSLAGMVADGFTSSSLAYLVAAQVFSQNPRPKEVVVGRLANAPTQRYAITPVAQNSTAYGLKAGGTAASFTSDASATVAEIIAGLKTAIDALTLGLTTSDQTTYLRAVVNTPGAFIPIETLNPNLVKVAQDNADPGIATDLDNIQNETDDWYAIVNPYASRAMVLAVAAWAESHEKLYLATLSETTVETGGYDVSGAADTGSELKRLAYARSPWIYHRDPASFAGAAWGGRLLPYTPGSETWAMKTLAGVASVPHTDSQVANIFAKNGNAYTTIAGVNIVRKGTVPAGEFVDVIRGRDWLIARLQERIFSVLANATKIPYTDEGIAVIEAEVRAQLQEGVDAGFLAANPEPVVTVPKASEVSSVDKGNRLLPDVTFEATLAGAIHQLTISGTIAV